MDRGKIASRQFRVLVIQFTIGTSILITPSSLAQVAKQDAWLASLIGVGGSLLVGWVYCALASRFPGMTLAEYTELILGKWLGKAASFLFYFFVFLLGAFMLRVMGDFMTTQIMPETPIEALMILFVGVVVMAARMGIETFSRAAEIFFPWMIFLFFFLVVLLAPQADIKRIEPVLEDGLKPVMLAAFHFFSLQELVVFLMLFPFVNRIHEARLAFLSGAAIGGIMLVVITTLSICVLGSEMNARSMYATYSLAKKINVGNYLQRMEVIVAIIWLLSIFFKTVLCFYSCALGIAQTMRLRDYRPLTLPLAMAMVLLAIVIYDNVADFMEFTPRIFSVYAFPYLVIFPVLLLTVHFCRNRVKEEPNEME